MRVTRVVVALALLAYVLLWVLACNGASSLVAPLLIPLVLAVLVAGGVALDRFIGLTPRRPKFDDPEHHDESRPQ